MMSKIEIPIPPKTLPLLHDAMCTIICNTLAALPPPKRIEVTYDDRRGLRKVVIENNIQQLLKFMDTFFGGPKLKPSGKISLNYWSYGLDLNRKISYFYAGSNKLPRYTAVRQTFMNFIRKQCYLFAKGQYFTSLRKEGKGLRPVAGYFEVGVNGGIAVMFNKALRSFSYTLAVQRERYTIYVLLGDVPLNYSIISDVVNYLYTFNKSKSEFTISSDIREVLTPRGVANILIEAPDLMYYNLLLKIVHDYSKGSIDVTEWPPIRIYVYHGEKDVLVFFNITYYDYDSLRKALSMLRVRYGLTIAKIASTINSVMSKLSEIVKGPKAEEASRALETLIPLLRIFINNLISGIFDLTTLHSLIRYLIGFESIDERFGNVAKILTALSH